MVAAALPIARTPSLEMHRHEPIIRLHRAFRPTRRARTAGSRKSPLLALWQYGAGRVAAFCSDAKPTWAAQWIADPVYPLFWNRIVSSVPHSRPPLRAEVHSWRTAGRARFRFDVRDENDAPADALEGSCTFAGASTSKASGPTWYPRGPGKTKSSLAFLLTAKRMRSRLT